MRKLLTIVLVLLLAFIVSGCKKSHETQLGDQAMQQGDLVAAHQYYTQALVKKPKDKEAAQQLVFINQTLTAQAIEKADQALGNAQESTIPDARRALTILDSAAQYDPDGSLLSTKRQRYSSVLAALNKNAGIHVKNTRNAIKSNNFDAAAKSMDMLRALDPESPVMPELSQELSAAKVKHLMAEIDKLRRTGKHAEALELLPELSALGVPEAEIAKLHKSLDKNRLKAVTTKAKSYMEANRYFSAYQLIKKSGLKHEMFKLTEDIRNQGGSFYLDQAKRRLEAGEVYRAFLESAKGYDIAPQLPGMFEIYRDTRDSVYKGLQQYIAISAFGAPQKNPDLGPQFSDALISYLFRILPFGVNIVEREKIDMLIEEQKREYQEVANILNVNMIVTGNVSLMNIDKQNTERDATVRAQVGSKKVVNPEYELALRLVDQNKLNPSQMPPAMIETPEYETFRYKKGTSTIKGFASVSVRIFDTAKGSITYAQEFNANFQASDDYQDSVDVAQISGDSLELPTDTEVMENLRNKIIVQLADVIRKQFANREGQLLRQAKYMLSRKEPAKAMRPLAEGFLYCVKAKIAPDNPQCAEIRELIVEETERDFLR